MDFYELLYQSIGDSNNEIGDSDELLCMITYDKLEDDHIKLDCNHCFNYEAIFNEVRNQKTRINNLEVQKLGKDQIKCPYCRNIQNSILPPSHKFPNITYVNYPIKYCMKRFQCKHVYKSGIRKGNQCERRCVKSYCTLHNRYYKKRDYVDLTLNNMNNTLRNMKVELEKVASILRTDLICNNDNCTTKCVGTLKTCYKHATENDKLEIKNLRKKRKDIQLECRELRKKIKEYSQQSKLS